MDTLLDLLKDNAPDLIKWGISLGLGAGGGFAGTKLALKKQRRVLANLQRPLMIIGTPGNGMTDQARILERSGLFSVQGVETTDKALDFLTERHRLLVLGYSQSPLFNKAFVRARSLQIPVLVFAPPRAIPDAEMTEICSYSFAAISNADLRLVSDVFTVMSTFPEKL